jgi:hypothetical protein
MTSFKQKLKSLLNDSSSFKDMSNIDQKFDQFLIRTYKKIKKDNAPQSIMMSNYTKYPQKTTRNFLGKSHCIENKRGISPNTAKSMAQTFHLMNKENSMNYYNSNYQNENFYNTLNRYLDNSSKIQRKIQKNIDYITKDNFNSRSKCSGINRPKSVFNYSTINKNSHNKNKIMYNMRKMFEKTVDKSSQKNGIDTNSNGFRKNIRKQKIDYNGYFNQFRNRQKYINFNF